MYYKRNKNAEQISTTANKNNIQLLQYLNVATLPKHLFDNS